MKSFEIEERIWEEGREEGIIQGKISDILKILNGLGEVPTSLKERISEQKDEETLFAWLMLAAKAESVAEFTKQI